MFGELILRFTKISRMSSARVAVVMRQTEARAAEFDDGRLIELAQGGLVAAAEVADLEARRRLQTGQRGQGAAARVDAQMDASVIGLFDGLSDEVAYLERTDDPRAADYRLIITKHFQGQVSTITRAAYEDELQRVERLHADLIGPFADLIAQAGLEKWVGRIGETLPAYRAALEAQVLVTGGDVLTARRQMHLLVCAVVGHVISTYLSRADAIEKLLAPLVDQQDRIAAIMRARRNGATTGPVDAGLIEGDGANGNAEDAAVEAVEQAEDALQAEAEAVEVALAGVDGDPLEGAPVGGGPLNGGAADDVVENGPAEASADAPMGSEG